MTEQKFKIWRCNSCTLQQLEAEALDYTSESYRISVDGSASPEDFHRRHEPEAQEQYAFVAHHLSHSSVLDIGSGAGTFLRKMQPHCARILAVEPAGYFAEGLKNQGFEYFSDISEAREQRQELCDAITCFAVLEHLENPREIFQQAMSLLKPGGWLFLSTPNSDDWLLQFLPEYSSFFYRRAHCTYFNQRSLEIFCQQIGLRKPEIQFKQRYDVSNFLHWLKDRKPTGLGKTPDFANLDSHFRKVLESTGRADYIYLRAQKEIP